MFCVSLCPHGQVCNCSFAMATGLQWGSLRAPHNCLAILGKPCLPASRWPLAPCWTPVMCICKLVRSGVLGRPGGGVEVSCFERGEKQPEVGVPVKRIGVTEGEAAGRGQEGTKARQVGSFLLCHCRRYSPQYWIPISVLTCPTMPPPCSLPCTLL